MTRQDKINSILNTIKENVEFPSIPVHLWIVAQTRQQVGDEEFEEWLKICTQCADIEYREARSRDSIFYKFVRRYGRREY